jgi:hypothetical protein
MIEEKEKEKWSEQIRIVTHRYTPPPPQQQQQQQQHNSSTYFHIDTCTHVVHTCCTHMTYIIIIIITTSSSITQPTTYLATRRIRNTPKAESPLFAPSELTSSK